jgi:transcriptional regulator with XRE-family HTH domain
MKLTDYLKQNSIRPSRFADQLGVPASTITRLLGGSKPGMELLEKIALETGGQVMPNDFLPFRGEEIPSAPSPSPIKQAGVNTP